MNAYSTIRQAVTAEIKKLTAELTKLQKMLSQLDDDSAPTERAATSGNSGNSGNTGKRKYTRRQKPSDGDVQSALKLIEKAGKSGIKAIKLAYEMKKAGSNKVGKAELLASEKVKMSGTGGGSTYTYIG